MSLLPENERCTKYFECIAHQIYVYIYTGDVKVACTPFEEVKAQKGYVHFTHLAESVSCSLVWLGDLLFPFLVLLK